MTEERFQAFTVLIAKINRSIRKIKAEEMAEFHLKSPHVSCIYYLYQTGSLTAKALCNVCEEDKAAISRSIDYLESNGYVTCNTEAKKRYKSPLCLTEKGNMVGEIIARKIDAILDLASAGLSIEHREILYKSLALIETNLEKICNEYGEKSNGN